MERIRLSTRFNAWAGYETVGLIDQRKKKPELLAKKRKNNNTKNTLPSTID